MIFSINCVVLGWDAICLVSGLELLDLLVTSGPFKIHIEHLSTVYSYTVCIQNVNFSKEITYLTFSKVNEDFTLCWCISIEGDKYGETAKTKFS